MVEIKGLTAGKRLASVVLFAALSAALTLGPAGTAFATAAAPASCIGHEASNLSPPGSSDEVPAGMRAFNAFFRENFPDKPSGFFMSTFARLHELSHQGCDEKFEEILTP